MRMHATPGLGGVDYSDQHMILRDCDMVLRESHSIYSYEDHCMAFAVCWSSYGWGVLLAFGSPRLGSTTIRLLYCSRYSIIKPVALTLNKVYSSFTGFDRRWPSCSFIDNLTVIRRRACWLHLQSGRNYLHPSCFGARVASRKAL